MSIKQLSIFLENRPGRLQNVTRFLGDAGCSILALSMADTKDFGILRILVDDVERAGIVLQQNGFLSQINSVSAVEIDSAPGSLAKILELLSASGVNVEYVYAMAEPRSVHPVMIFRFDEPEKAIDVLKSEGLHLLTEDELLGKTK